MTALLVDDHDLSRLEVRKRAVNCELVPCRQAGASPPASPRNPTARATGPAAAEGGGATLTVGFTPAISASANRSRANTCRAHRLRRPGTSDTWAAINRVPVGLSACGHALERPLGYDQHIGPKMIVLEGHADDDGVRVHHGSKRDRELQRTIAQPRTSLHLDLDPSPVVQAVHERIDTSDPAAAGNTCSRPCERTTSSTHTSHSTS